MLAVTGGHVGAARTLVDAFPRCVGMVDAKGVDALALCAMSGGGESTVLIPVLLGLDVEKSEGHMQEGGGGGGQGRTLAASPHSRDADGNTPLHHASAAGNMAALRMLLAAGANPLAKNDYDWTPLAYSQTVAAEVYFKNLVAEFERRKVEGLRVGEERERQRAAGVRLVDDGGSGGGQAREDLVELPAPAGRQWSSPRRPERGLGIEGMRMRAGSAD